MTLPLAAQLAVDLLHHRAHPVGAVCREHVHLCRALAPKELPQRCFERKLTQAPGKALIDDREVRIEPCRQRMCAQQPRAKAVEGANERRLCVARRLAIAER